MTETLAFLSGGGEMGERMRAHDWAATPLGAPETWPQSLRSVLGTCLNSPMLGTILWGPDLRMLYNDAYIPSMADRHPAALGRPVAEVWGDAWEQVAEPFHRAVRTGEGFANRQVELRIFRGGTWQTTWWDFTGAPIRDEDGRIAGLLNQGVEVTDQVLVQRRLLEERNRLARLFEQAPTFMAMLHGPEHRFELTNPGYQRLIGGRQVLGRTVAEALPDAVAQGYLDLLDDVYRSGRAYTAVGARYAVEAQPGVAVEERFVDFVYQPIFGEDGQVTGVFVEGVDVTERTRGALALHASEERYRTLIETIDIGFCIIEMKFDAEGRAVDYRLIEGNAAFERQTGLVGSFGKWVSEVAPGLERYWFDLYGAVALTGEPLHFENGAAIFGRYYDVRALRIGDPADHRVAILFSDISERRRMEEALRVLNESLGTQVEERTAERDLLANVLRTTDTFVHILDLDYRWLAVNPAGADEFERVFGRRPAVGDRMLDLLDHLPAERVAVEAVWSRALAGEEFTVVATYGDPEGAGGAYEMKFNTLRDAAGRRVGAFQMVTDVTERLRNQKELAETQEALRQSQKLEAVGQLTGGVAHDFNNLLTIIRSSVDLLRRPDLPAARKERYLDAVSDTVDRASKLTGQLLAFARRQTLKPEVFDVGARLRGVAEMLDTVTGARIHVATAVPASPAFVRADLSQFETALVNMAVNARDAMEGEGRLTLHLGAGAPLPAIRGHAGSALAFAAVSVTDTGCGIPPETLDRIFEPFFTTKEVGKGTGLGLSQVFGFAKQSGGDVDVRSTVGEGTTFTLYLPQVAIVRPQEQPRDDETGASPAGRGQRVLVVEDNIEVGRFCTQILEDLGYRTTWATNAEEALDRLGREGARFDVVFSDVVMPGMGGVELARRLRISRPDLPVVLASGYSHVLSREDDHGFELLNKPYSAEQLARVLHRVASGAEARRDPA